MSDTTASLRHQIGSADQLQAVVRTMKAVAASSIGEYENAVVALADYYRTVELGLGACLRASTASGPTAEGHADERGIGAIVFGSDQGLVGPFNDVVADHAVKALAGLPGTPQVWAVGDRVRERLADAGLAVVGLFEVPASVRTITSLVGRIQVQSEGRRAQGQYAHLYVFHNRPRPGSLYEPVGQRLLPLDAEWQRGMTAVRWPTATLPQVIPGEVAALGPLVREYLFISLFRACAESLASENASRLAAMQRADKNIDDLLDGLHRTFHRLRQGGIDEELFDVVSGFEALNAKGT